MTRHIVTFAGSRYDGVVERWFHKGSEFGFDQAWCYDDVWMSQHPFWTLNHWLQDHPGDRNGKRGLNWYAFKPLVIQHCLERLAPGDLLIYVDGDTRPIADLSPIYNHAAEHGAMFFAASAHMNHRWVKRDCFIAMGLDDMFGRTDMQAGCARFMAFRKGDGVTDWKERQLLQEWLVYAINRYATTFDASRYVRLEDACDYCLDAPSSPRNDGWASPQDHPDFQEHRTEQAILSLLMHKYGYAIHREPCQAGNDFRDQPGDYPQLFEQSWLGSGHPVEGSRYRRVPE